MRISLLLILALTQSICQSQSYFPFPDSNAVWTELYTTGMPSTKYSYDLYLNGDTVIDTTLYSKVYKRNYINNYNVLQGVIREDLQKHIWYIDYTYTNPDEILLYDFSKDIGDTVYAGLEGLSPCGFIRTLTRIDSILINSEYRKTYYFDNLISDTCWIEGIGSTRGLLSPITPVTTGFHEWELICYKENDSIVYFNPNYNECYIVTKIQDQLIQGLDVIIFPNPINGNGILTILFEQPLSKQYRICLYNSIGQKMGYYVLNMDCLHIKLPDLNQGIYFLHIYGIEHSQIIKLLVN